MRQIESKSRLAIVLSGLKGFESPKVRQEQYATDSEVAASMLWNGYTLGDIEGKVMADLGCGTGILGIGALLLGAKEVLFVDSDGETLEKGAKNNIAKVKSEGYELGKASFICQDLANLAKLGESGIEKVDTVIQNPPFGTKTKHADRIFVEKALEMAPVAYSLHKSESKAFLERFLAHRNAEITHIWDFKYPLKATFSFHRRQIHRIDVSCFRFKRRI